MKTTNLPSITRTPQNIETVEGIVAEEIVGLSFLVAVNGKMLFCRIHPGIPRAPVFRDHVAVQILSQYGLGLIIAVLN